MKRALFLFCLFSLNVFAKPPASFVDINTLDPSIVVEARYFTSYNFIGRPIRGYKANKCFLTRAAAKSLLEVQKDLKTKGLGLKIYDCYRPQKAVDHFVRWAQNLNDLKMKTAFYPHVAKSELFKKGYIAEKSGHSRGSTLDLTILPYPPSNQLSFPSSNNLQSCLTTQRFSDNSVNMGAGYDCFDPVSHTDHKNISRQAKRNRKLLKKLMTRHGFINYDKEWWHYTLKNEPYPKTYFNFDVK